MAQPHQGRHFLNENLTEEQQQMIRETVQNLRDQGASREDIHAAVAELFESWGLKLPERPGRGHGPQFHQLTEQQRETLKSTIQDLREQGASREEIHKAVAELFESWGLERPKRLKDLSRIEKKQLRQYIRSLRKQGLSRQEIRAAVREWLQGLNKATEMNDDNFETFNAPNPFNPSTTITFSLDEPSEVRIKIFNIKGQLIQSFDQGMQNTGSHRILWNGVNETGEQVPSGTYLYQIQAGDKVSSKQMLLLK
ncbi:MAG: FlgD immunoglobulin-like domain containing protein [candidate division KSB1 bacterium]|nr:FlgD immunoglobulin-like domain containing protein [candidate division KSB1 bacterium]